MNVVEMPREKLLTVRMNADEAGQLKELAKLTRLSESDIVRKLVGEELTRVKRQDEIERQRRDRYWTLDKKRLQRTAEVSGVRGLTLTFNDDDRTVTVVHDGRVVARDEDPSVVPMEFLGMPGSRFVHWTSEGTVWVAKSAIAAREAQRAMGNANDVTPALAKRLNLTEVHLDR